jgi:glycine/D-amino acid oxidase-like deaminating enzyme
VAVETEAMVVITGAGVVGYAVAEHLAELGWGDLLPIDQGLLFQTGGSTSHAPGLVLQTNPSKTMTDLATYTASHLRELLHEGVPCFRSAASRWPARPSGYIG